MPLLTPKLFEFASQKQAPPGKECQCGVVHTKRFTKIDRDPCRKAILIFCAQNLVDVVRTKPLKPRIHKIRALYLHMNRILDAKALARPYRREWVRGGEWSRLLAQILKWSDKLDVDIQGAIERSPPSKRHDAIAAWHMCQITINKFRHNAKLWCAADYRREDGLTQLLGRDIASHVRQFL